MSDHVIRLGRLPSRSMGAKLLLVCGLALLMSIPALFVFALLMDRTHRASEVEHEIGGVVGGRQTFLGPVVAVPYRIPAATNGQAQVGVYVVFPERGSAKVSSTTELRRRSLFSVPMYKADLDFNADFDLSGVSTSTPPGAVLDWSRSQILVGASDLRGAGSDMTLKVGGKSLVMAPASMGFFAGSDASEILRFAGADVGAFAAPGSRLQVEARLKFSGAEHLAVLPFARTTTLEMSSDWPSPSFDGGFLPVARTLTPKGFSASWSVPFVARGAPGEGTQEVIARLQPSALGVSFVEPANPYQSVGRALKYAVLFVGLVFLAYFLFESSTGRRMHPAQYVLVGLAQMIFYLLLLSIAEQLGFDWAFGVAAVATVGLISVYAGWVFESRRQGLIALAAFSLLYGLIYVLMRLEDLALLVGAVSSFAAIAAVMYFTRRINWYDAAEAAPTPAKEAG